MAEESYPFTGAPILNELQWARLMRNLGFGVVMANPSDPALKVTANGTATISVAAGEAVVNGFKHRLDTTKSLSVPTNFGNASPRVDRVVLRCSQTANSVTAAYRTGGTVAPSLATDLNDVYDLPLAQVTVAAGATVAAGGGVVDERYSLHRPAAGFGNVPNQYGTLRYVGGQLDIGDGSGWHPILLGDGPRARVWQSGTGQVLGTNAARYVIFNSDTYDADNMHPTTGDPGYRKITVPTAGVYEVLGGVSYDGNGTGERSMIIVKNAAISAGGAGTGGNGVARCSISAAPSTAETAIQCAGEVLMAAGDTLAVQANQTSGGNLGLTPGSDRVFLQVKWVRSSL